MRRKEEEARKRQEEFQRKTQEKFGEQQRKIEEKRKEMEQTDFYRQEVLLPFQNIQRRLTSAYDSYKKCKTKRNKLKLLSNARDNRKDWRKQKQIMICWLKPSEL